jgi:hypothetical protein
MVVVVVMMIVINLLGRYRKVNLLQCQDGILTRPGKLRKVVDNALVTGRTVSKGGG